MGEISKYSVTRVLRAAMTAYSSERGRKNLLNELAGIRREGHPNANYPLDKRAHSVMRELKGWRDGKIHDVEDVMP